eukprot:scaffold38170_cov45-Phaeocystis_antarctica.AAC.1
MCRSRRSTGRRDVMWPSRSSSPRLSCCYSTVPRCWAHLGTSWYTTAVCWTGSTPTRPPTQHRCRQSTQHCQPQR